MKWWTFLNSAFFLWLLSSVVLGSGTFLYAKWEENREKRRFEAEQLASLKESTFDSLSTDLSTYVFRSDILTKGFEEEWWKRSGLESFVPKYNDAINAVRGKEFLYRGKVKRLWGAKEEELLTEVIKHVRVFDDLIHKLNKEIGAVTSDETCTINFSRLQPIVTKELRPEVEALETKSKALLDRLAEAI